MLLLSLLFITLIGFGIYLERRLTKLEMWVALYDESLIDRVVQPADSSGPAQPAEEVAQTVEQMEEVAPKSAILYAEPRPESRTADSASSESEEDRDEPPEAWPEPVAAREPRFALSIEELFGRRLPIWAGGITLAVAGFFIVKLSIEAGLLSPPVRVISGMIFGIVLIGAAEVALRYHERVGDARVRQALSGAGLATLYASILVAANLYHLVPPVIAMLGVASVTAAAMFLSIRFGAPSALLGLAGGLSAPALIGSTEPNVPLLTMYLAFAVGGLATLSRNQRWAWLGISALVGGFGWGAVLLLGGALDLSSTIAVGMYLLLLGVGLPALGLAGGRNDQLQLIAGIVAAAQMAALVATGGFALLNWALFGSIAAATVWLATREPKLERLPAVGMVIALLLAGAWPHPDWRNFAPVLAGIILIHALMPVRRLWTERGGLLEAGQIAAIALGSWLVSMLHFHWNDGSNDVTLGLLAVGFAAGTAMIAAAGWRVPGRRDDARFTTVSTSAALLLAAASTLLLPDWSYGVAIAAVGLGLLDLGQRAEDPRLEPLAWIFAAGGLIACFIPDAGFANERAIDSLRFGLIAATAALFAWRGGYPKGRATAQFVAAGFVYFAVALWLDERVEPSFAALLLLAAAYAGQIVRGERFVAAMTATALIVAYWAIGPIYRWADGATLSLTGDPLLVQAVPSIQTATAQLLLPAALAGVAIWIAASRLRQWERATALALAAIPAAVGAHSLYKHIFAIATPDAFVGLGLAERTLWEIALAGLALLAFRLRKTLPTIALAFAAAMHEAYYTLVLHNPLWSAQAVGIWPIANWLLPVYALALGLATWGKRQVQPISDGVARSLGVVQMILIVLLAFSELRQLFHGTLLVDPGLNQAEDIARSVLAIAVAVAFLVWGIARENRDWRVASLVLMLAAVGKVFLFDASGLEGVVRITSFVALGLSLIGIGWLYSLYLPSRADQVAKAGSSR